jgi:hypothetical protein
MVVVLANADAVKWPINFRSFQLILQSVCPSRWCR